MKINKFHSQVEVSYSISQYFKPKQWASVTEHTIIPSATKATGRLSLWKMQEEKLL